MTNIPKDSADRVRRNAAKFEDVEVSADGELRGFPLPHHPNYKWCQLTQEWWEMWRRSPQSTLMAESDWWALLVAAMLHHEIWRTRAPRERRPSFTALTNMMSELKRREDAVGSTWESRAKLRMKITTEEVEKERQLKTQGRQIVNYAEQLANASQAATDRAAAEAKKLVDDAIVTARNNDGRKNKTKS